MILTTASIFLAFNTVMPSHVSPFAIMATLVLFLGGCASTITRNPVPEQLIDRAEVIDAPGVRIWADPNPNELATFVTRAIKQTRAAQPAFFKPGARPNVSFLALSGGGADGAYGAGFLQGWTRSGRRPRFQIVTGVSAGALIAPFAFLGPKYDSILRKLFTSHSTDDFARPQILSGLLGGLSVADDAGLRDLIARYADRALLREIAREHAKGRRLYIATSNLDAQRGVIWDMGAIASSRSPNALQLFRNVLLASASIPGIFPPVKIDVSAGGRRARELHVDGGLSAQVFFMPLRLLIRPIDKKFGIAPQRTIYVLRNTRIEPQYDVVKPTTVAISARSVATLIKSQGRNDLLKIYVAAQRNRMRFRMSSIPPDFDVESREPFDTVYMKALFKRGIREGRRLAWQSKPPQLR